jgi:nitrite reductase (NADH) large subunit
MTNYLIVGNGVAGTTAAEEIRNYDPSGKIMILTDEDMAFYSRIRLPEYIAGEVAEERLVVKNPGWYADLRIDLSLNTKIIAAEGQNKRLIAQNGQVFPYDVLLIATGSRSFLPPVKGMERKGVFALRHIVDAREISAWAGQGKQVVLIGGGLLGLESGNALRKLGKKVTVVEFFPRLLPRQLDAPGAAKLQVLMEKMGFEFRLGAKTLEITGSGAVGGVILEGGERLPADMVIISAGVRPNLDVAGFFGLDADKGIKVDAHLKTSRADVFAAGDAAEFNGMVYGIWPAATDQGRIAGANMTGQTLVYGGTPMSNKLKVVDIDLASAGNIDADGKMESVVVGKENIYKKIVFDGNTIAGCILLGETTGFNQIVKAMADKKDVSAVKEEILTQGFDYQSLKFS